MPKQTTSQELFFFLQFCLMSHPPVGLLASATAAFASIALADKTGTKVRSIRTMDQITIKTKISKCRLFLKIDFIKGPDARCLLFICPPGVVMQFCRFGIWSNTQCITPVDALHTTQSPSPPPVLSPVLIHAVTRTSEKVRRALVHKRGRKY